MTTKSKYIANNFSTENFPNSDYKDQDNLNEKKRTNIRHLLKRIHDEKKRERKSAISIGFAFFFFFLIFSFVQN